MQSGSFDVSLKCQLEAIAIQEICYKDLYQHLPRSFAAFDVDPNQVDILTPIVNITNLGDTDVDCYYNFGDGGSMQGCNGQYIYSNGGNFTITQTVINEAGCTNTAIGEVSISGSVFYAPNSFTPNNDGINDVWLPICLGVVHIDLEF